ncbi:MAG: hypothetical protein V1702_02680 [Candidatus Woesearchaeota archaeon]
MMENCPSSNNLKVLCLLFIATLLISGCGKNKGDVLDPGKIIYSGSEGVMLEFALNAPPERVTAGQEFPILVKLTNKGAVNVVGAFLVITAESPRFETLNYNTIIGTREEPLEGKEANYVGGMLMYEVKETAALFPTGTVDQPSSLNGVIMATVCYNYTTKFSTSACIDVEPYTLKNTVKACEMETMTLKDQGAPIAVTKIGTSVVVKGDGATKTKTPQFKIFFQNLGRGLTVDPGKILSACSSATSDVTKDLYNVVYIKGKLGEDDLDCDIFAPGTDGKRTITDNSDENYFLCQSSNPIGETTGSFVTDINLTLSYGYTETISKIIKIEGQS